MPEDDAMDLNDEGARSMSKPDRVVMLRGLADFFDRWPEYRTARGDDAFSPALGRDEVQRDLREWADELALRAVPESDDDSGC